jgi:hypothetical protein
MAIKIERVESLEHKVDKVLERGDTVGKHVTEALIACEDGKSPRSALLRVSSTLAQLAKDAEKASEAAQKCADAAFELKAPKATKVLPAKPKAKARKAKAEAPPPERLDGTKPGAPRKVKSATRAKKGSKK